MNLLLWPQIYARSQSPKMSGSLSFSTTRNKVIEEKRKLFYLLHLCQCISLHWRYFVHRFNYCGITTTSITACKIELSNLDMRVNRSKRIRLWRELLLSVLTWSLRRVARKMGQWTLFKKNIFSEQSFQCSYDNSKAKFSASVQYFFFVILDR